MQEEKNKIEKILNPDGNEQGLIKQEIDLFNEFLETQKIGEKQDIQLHIINFEPLILDDKKPNQDFIKLAAQTSQSIEKNIQSKFYISSNSDYAIKLDFKDGDQVYASIIVDSSIEIMECVLYCPQIDKYYTSNLDDEFYIGFFDNFDISKFSFQLIFFFESIRFQKTGENFIPFTEKDRVKIMDTKIVGNNLVLKIDIIHTIKCCVLKNKGYKDFLNIKDNVVDIPIILLSTETQLILY